MQPECSDGFASVGTILPKEKVALLPGGLFACAGPVGCELEVGAATATRDLSLRRWVDALMEWCGFADGEDAGL
jgi:hypothetical protein